MNHWWTNLNQWIVQCDKQDGGHIAASCCRVSGVQVSAARCARAGLWLSFVLPQSYNNTHSSLATCRHISEELFSSDS